MKFGGKGGLRAPWREGLPPKPLAKERPNKLGGTRPRQGPSLAGRQSDGDSSRRPGSALGNPPPLIPLPTNKWEGEAAVQCLQSNRWLTMSSHETHVAAHRKPVLFAIVYLAGKRTGHGGQTRAAASRATGLPAARGPRTARREKKGRLRLRRWHPIDKLELAKINYKYVRIDYGLIWANLFCIHSYQF